MHYVLLSSTGNMIDSYDEEAGARAALQRIVEAEPDAAEHIALLTYDESGLPTGDPQFAKVTTATR